MKRFLSLLALVVTCLTIGACSTQATSAPERVLSLSSRLALDIGDYYDSGDGTCNSGAQQNLAPAVGRAYDELVTYGGGWLEVPPGQWCWREPQTFDFDADDVHFLGIRGHGLGSPIRLDSTGVGLGAKLFVTGTVGTSFVAEDLYFRGASGSSSDCSEVIRSGYDTAVTLRRVRADAVQVAGTGDSLGASGLGIFAIAGAGPHLLENVSISNSGHRDGTTGALVTLGASVYGVTVQGFFAGEMSIPGESAPNKNNYATVVMRLTGDNGGSPSYQNQTVAIRGSAFNAGAAIAIEVAPGSGLSLDSLVLEGVKFFGNTGLPLYARDVKTVEIRDSVCAKNQQYHPTSSAMFVLLGSGVDTLTMHRSRIFNDFEVRAPTGQHLVQAYGVEGGKWFITDADIVDMIGCTPVESPTTTNCEDVTIR